MRRGGETAGCTLRDAEGAGINRVRTSHPLVLRTRTALAVGESAGLRRRIEVTPAGIRLQDLGYRWGVCGKGALRYFHLKAILLPARIAEYVGVHEMAHLHEQHHTPEFWRRAERAMPDFERRKV